MNKLVVGLAAIFAVIVAVFVILDTFGSIKDNQDEASINTRYSASVGSAANNTNSNTEQSAPKTKTYSNEEFYYTLEYPEGVVVDCPKSGDSIDESSKICLYIKEDGVSRADSLKMYIDVRDPDLFSSRYEETMEQRLRDYAEEIWQMNRDERSSRKKVSTLTNTKVDGRTAYKFTTTYSYTMETGTTRIDDEWTIIFVDNSDRVKFNITYPTEEEVFEEILDTIEFN